MSEDNFQIYPTIFGIPIPIPLLNRWTFLIGGIMLFIGGIIYGNTSHHISYQAIHNKSFTPYIVNGGTDYLQEDNTSNYFILHENDFSPTFKLNDNIHNDVVFTFIARSDSTYVDVSFTDGTHLKGTGYTIEQITVFDSRGQKQIFSTSEYIANPQGIYVDNWIPGRISIFVGLVLAFLALLAVYGSNSEEVDAITLLITVNAIKKYTPEAMTQNANGEVNINALIAISKLFSKASDVLKDSKIKKWTKAKKLHVSIPLQEGPATIDEAVQSTVVGLLQRNIIPREQLEKRQVYSFVRGGREPTEKAYLIIVGNISALTGKGIRFHDTKP